jgi:hypothetical protein
MKPIQKVALGIIAALMALMAFVSLGISRANPITVSSPDVDLNAAWMQALRTRDYETLNQLTCHPSARVRGEIMEQVSLVDDILLASSAMQLNMVRPQETQPAVVVETRLHLSRSVRGENKYSSRIAINSSSTHYCVIGWALDRAFWPPR